MCTSIKVLGGSVVSHDYVPLQRVKSLVNTPHTFMRPPVSTKCGRVCGLRSGRDALSAA